MKKKLLSLLAALGLMLSLTACEELYGITIITSEDGPTQIIGGADGPTAVYVSDGENDATTNSAGVDMTDEADELYAINEDSFFDTKDEVAFYLYTYNHLPDNYITKNEARDLGWEGGDVEEYAGQGYAIGGDRFGNYEGILPAEYDYRECDIDTVGSDSRGAKRIVFSEDCQLIYYTEDHYESFELLYGEE